MSLALPDDYAERVYAGWTGKCIGVRLGAPLENWTYDQIKGNLGQVTDFLPLPEGKLFKPDDDTAFPLIMIRALQDYGPEVTAAQMGECVLNYLGDQRGTFWWGGYGLSTEHTAYINLANGISAPQSGSIAMNGAAVAEQIGGQIFSDIWGFVAPNRPDVAMHYAVRAASVGHDGEGLHGARFIAALVSMAFSESDPAALVKQGLSMLDPTSEYARVVRDVLLFWESGPDDWHACYEFLRHNYGYDRYPGMVHIIPNTGIVVMALLYCDGDFSRAVQIATMGGWDTDCNAGNVGAIMGVAVGLDGIDDHWRRQMHELLVGANLIGERNLTDIAVCADLFSRCGALLAGQAAASKPHFHFGYPGAHHGVRATTRRAEVVDLRQEDGALAVVLRDLKKKGEATAFWRIYCRPDELSANYYGASFSPMLYPGEEIRARIYAPDAADGLIAALYVWDDNHSRQHQAVAVPLPGGKWVDLFFQIPQLHNALLSEVGLTLHTMGDSWSGKLLLDYLTWDGVPAFSTDFQQERAEYGAISQWTYLRGNWRVEQDGYHGSAATTGESYTGAQRWEDIQLTVGIKPILGGYHNVNVRVQGASRSYAVGLAPDNRLVIYKNVAGYREVASTTLEWSHGERYELRVRAAGNAIDVWVNDAPMLNWKDDSAPYLHGQIGLSVLGGSHACYTDLSIEGAPA